MSEREKLPGVGWSTALLLFATMSAVIASQMKKDSTAAAQDAPSKNDNNNPIVEIFRQDSLPTPTPTPTTDLKGGERTF